MNDGTGKDAGDDGQGVAISHDQLAEIHTSAALEYAERGWHVFPLRPFDKRPAFPNHAEDRCTDSGRPRGYRPDAWCRHAGRHVTWEERATTDPARIRRAWSTPTPDGPYGIGIACGPSGLVVVDLDVPKPDRHGVIPTPPPAWDQPGIHDGLDVLAALAEEAGQPFPFGSTYSVQTPTGGVHVYFKAPYTPDGMPPLRNTAGTLGWLIDTRAAGGYVVASPTSLGYDRYVLMTDMPVAPLPDWLADRLTPKPIPTGQTTVQLTHPAAKNRPGQSRRAGRTERETRYLVVALMGELNAVADAQPGARNKTLFEAASALGQLVAGGELTAAEVTARLTAAAELIGLTSAEIRRTIASGLLAGAKRPRTLADISTAPAKNDAQSPGAAA